MSQAERLQDIYPFDEDVLEAVERTGSSQHNTSFQDYMRSLSTPETQIFSPLDGKPIEIIDIKPKDYDSVVVYHLPMGCLLDSNMMMHVATLAQSQPDKRVISVGNPGQPGRNTGKLSLVESARVWSDDFRPTVGPSLEYLNSQGIHSAAHAGISYGADKAAASAENAHYYDHKVSPSIMIEPVSVAKSGLIKMALTFASTGKYADKYLKPVRNNSRAFVNAEQLKESSLGYGLGLARLSNLAIGRALGREGFEGRVERAMVINPNMKTGLGWGTASEFDNQNERSLIAARLKRTFGADRVAAIALEGQTHAMNLDIFLNAALISQLLKDTL